MASTCGPLKRGLSHRIGLSLVPLLLVSFLHACGGSQVVHDRFDDEAIGPPPDTTLGPGDVFDVRVYGEKDLSSTFRVASDGSIDYPLLRTINVSGKTPTEVANLIEQGLKEGGFLNRPEVSIFVKEYNSKKISVFGQVKKPGTFPYEEGMSVVEAITVAGGFTSMARENDTTVIRVVEGIKKRYRVPVEMIGQGKAANFTLMTGDIIFVPERIF